MIAKAVAWRLPSSGSSVSGGADAKFAHHDACFPMRSSTLNSCSTLSANHAIPNVIYLSCLVNSQTSTSTPDHRNRATLGPPAELRLLPKMSNRRIKSLEADGDYGDEDYYEDNYDGGDGDGDGDGDNELTEDDKEQMRLGTTKVRETLGPAFAISDKDIQEALWHYYYDVEKSAAYLRSMEHSLGHHDQWLI
jgi:HBS1 N-terminus